MRRQLSGFILLFTTFPAIGKEQFAQSGVWRQIREGASGYSAVTGPESNVLIQASGTDWLDWRNELISGTGAWGIALTVLLLGVFFLMRGRVKLTEPRSGELVERWTRKERWLHCYTASLFLLLAFSGLVLLYGRELLIGLFQHQTFAGIAQTSKIIHNYAGPLFIVGLMMMAIIWTKDNLPSKVDLLWFKQFGGLIGNRHPPAGRMNGGEKAWFWLLIVFGLVVSVTGLILDFSNLVQERYWLQISHILHTCSAFILMMGALGHIYIGSIGSEGALEGMITGKVDTSWARQHHDLWYEGLRSEAANNERSRNDKKQQ